MKTFQNLLQNTPLFTGFTPKEIELALQALDAETTTYRKDSLILEEGQLTDRLGIILEGSITIERIDYLGNRSILNYNHKGQLFAETYALLNAPLMVDVVATKNCWILFLHMKKRIQASLQKETWYIKFIDNLLKVATQKNLALSKHNFHTSSKSIRGRVLSYLSDIAKESNCYEFDIPLNRQQMADYLGVDRSALSGELSKMRKDGILQYRKNHFILHESF